MCAVSMPRVGEPGEDRVADELRAIVRAQIPERAVCADQAGKDLDHAAVENEVVGPDMIGTKCWQRPGA